MQIRTGIRAGGAAADDHQFGPHVEIGREPVSWHFAISRGSGRGWRARIAAWLGWGGTHLISPPMDRASAKEGARALAQGDVQGARARWGQGVAGWLDGRAEEAREALLEAARESVQEESEKQPES